MMRKLFGNEKTTPVDAQIDAVLDEMHDTGVLSDEYPKLMSYLERLNEVKAKEAKAPVSRDMLVQVAGSLAGILLIVAYEQKHVMTSKGFGFSIRPK